MIYTIGTSLSSYFEDEELVLDVDDLYCLIQQVVAIGKGWAWPVSYTHQEIPELKVWEWKNEI